MLTGAGVSPAGPAGFIRQPRVRSPAETPSPGTLRARFGFAFAPAL